MNDKFWVQNMYAKTLIFCNQDFSCNNKVSMIFKIQGSFLYLKSKLNLIIIFIWKQTQKTFLILNQILLIFAKLHIWSISTNVVWSFAQIVDKKYIILNIDNYIDSNYRSISVQIDFNKKIRSNASVWLDRNFLTLP